MNTENFPKKLTGALLFGQQNNYFITWYPFYNEFTTQGDFIPD